MIRLRSRSLGWMMLGFVLAFAVSFAFDQLFSNEVTVAADDASTLAARVAALEKRVSGLKLAWGDQINGQPFICSAEEVKQPPYVMVGAKDGTGCGVENLNYYRKLELVIPE